MGPPLPGPPPPMDATRLAALARDTKRRLDWDRILVMRDSVTGDATPWKWVENARNFAIYTKTERDVHAVLAVGTIKASANEIAALLTASTTQEYARKMEALHGHDFKDATYQYDVEPHGSGTKYWRDASPATLSVRSLTFAKPSGSWLARHDAWCHLDAVYKDHAARRVEQVLTMLRPRDVLSRKTKLSGNTEYTKEGVVAAYRIDEQTESVRSHGDPAFRDPEHFASSGVRNNARSISGSRQRFSSRVHFYAEMPHSSSYPASSRGVCSDHATKQRLYQVAKNCHRLSLLIRRRRLGMQALVGRTRFLPPTNTPCFCCNTKLLVAKVCRICGQGVCGDCSDKYERETDKRIESVRVCDPCLDRVESCDYSSMNESSLAGPRIVEDAVTPYDDNAAEAELRYLLREALVKCKSPEHQASVLNVIRYMLDQDEDAANETMTTTSSGLPTPGQSSLLPQRSIEDVTLALNALQLETIRHDEAVYRSNDDRTYRMDTRDRETMVVDTPLPDNEEERLRAVAQVDIDQLSNSVELAILSELAAVEMGCSMSVISIFDRDTCYCVAANIDSLQRATLPRSSTLCAHTLMEKTPNLVPHPEADIRFTASATALALGVHFYFAFPVMDVSEQIIGSFCVMHESSMEVTATKYAAFKKLSETCNKVVRLHAAQRRCLSSVSNSSSS